MWFQSAQGFLSRVLYALCELENETERMEKQAEQTDYEKIPANVICVQWDNTYRHMSWRSYSPSWPYPPAAPVWGCPGGERGRNEKPHIRAIRLGTILLLNGKEAGVNVGHSEQIREEEKTQTENSHQLKLEIELLNQRPKVLRVCANLTYIDVTWKTWAWTQAHPQ